MYEDYEVPSISFTIWFEDHEFKKETILKVLDIFEQGDYTPHKRVEAAEHYKTYEGYVKYRDIKYKPKEEITRSSKDFLVDNYLNSNVSFLAMSRYYRFNDIEEGWSFSWMLPLNRSKLVLSQSPHIADNPSVNIINFSTGYYLFNDKEKKNSFIKIFEDLIILLDPIYAKCDDAASGVYQAEAIKEFNRNFVQTIAWANYFRQEVCEDIGFDILENLPVAHKERLGNGFYFSLTDDLLDAKDNPDFKLRREILRKISKSKYVQYSRIPRWISTLK